MKEKKDIKVYSLQDEQHPSRFFRLEKMEDHYDDVNGTTDDPHRHDFYAIIWIKKGKGFHLVDFNKYDLEDNQIYFLSPGQIHQISTTEKPYGWVLSFSADFLLINNIPTSFIKNINLFKPYNESPPLKLEDEPALTIESVIEQMLPFFEGDGAYKNEALGALLQLLLIHCNHACEFPEPLETQASCVLIDFRNEVESHYMELHKVNEYANRLNITPKHLNEVVKENLGYTAKEYILDRIIMEAKRLLLHSDLSSKQVALHLGFKEPVHFSTFFKNIVGVTPGQFKQEFSK
ncbi:AraC family transcriptional regulator [Fulvivirga lutea]|uniref:AraC family transcriptional regulator n=1 Tax=Fulvivirga lutea TaxID=2810512 RepID=A0A974ZZS4_9BACT|nr:helix-turn-helix transcriptional regulator [Fulvivirga lutea]QSE96456.1 AraC family transcriptional regulator [Fulvivirga lutea]